MEQTYKITKGSWTGYINFESLQAAQDWADAKGAGYTVELASAENQLFPPTIKEKVAGRFEFGRTLQETFLEDNAQYEVDNNTIITTEESIALTLKLQLVLGFAQTGAIRDIANILPSIEVDTIFTQARKDKYSALINAFLNS